MKYEEAIERLNALADPDKLPGVDRYAIRPDAKVLGIRVPKIRELAKEIRKDHALAEQLWTSGIHEGRLLATMIADPKQFTPEKMDEWAQSFDAWDVCDQACSNVFRKTRFAYEKVVDWCERDEEFVKRAGFALMATLAVHDKKAADVLFMALLPLIEREADDERNFVKKAVNWALRQIGKRNLTLNAEAIQTAVRIAQRESKAARWIASDALRELQSEKVQEKLRE
jgi:3-methyladenine DNA glycosylase AlkD